MGKVYSAAQLTEYFGRESPLVISLDNIDFSGWVIQHKMSDSQIPKRLLFGWFSQKCPTHGAKLHWQDFKTFSAYS